MSQTDEADCLYEGGWLDVHRRYGREFVTRKHCTGIAVVTAITTDDRLVLTEQYRPAMDQNVLELPAGMAGDEAEHAQESIMQAAQRELLEETGFDAGPISVLTDGPISSGFSDEIMHFYLATKLQHVHAGGGDESETITVHTLPLNGIEQHILTLSNRHSLLVDPKIWIGLYFLHMTHLQKAI